MYKTNHTFFMPHNAFLEWLSEYARGRFVIEVGAGQCEFTKAMHRMGIKAMAVEPAGWQNEVVVQV